MKTLESFREDSRDFKFKVIAVPEYNVTYNTVDDYYRRCMFEQEGIENMIFTLEEVIHFLGRPDQKYPLWIKVKLIEETENDLLFELRFSMRLRKPTQLKYIETGHPPFIWEE